MKEFDYEKAKAGAPVCTRNGMPARIVCWDAIGDQLPILALVTDENAKGELCELSYWYNEKGKSDDDYELDLMMATVKCEGWVIVGTEKKYCCSSVYDTQEEAEAIASPAKPNVVVAHIEWEE